MWVMDKWEAWSKKQYDVWGSKLQEKYDFWKNYDDPDLREKCKKVWSGLSASMQKKIYNLLVEALEKYGAEFAKELLVKLSEAFLKLSGVGKLVQ